MRVLLPQLERNAIQELFLENIERNSLAEITKIFPKMRHLLELSLISLGATCIEKINLESSHIITLNLHRLAAGAVKNLMELLQNCPHINKIRVFAFEDSAVNKLLQGLAFCHVGQLFVENLDEPTQQTSLNLLQTFHFRLNGKVNITVGGHLAEEWQHKLLPTVVEKKNKKRKSRDDKLREPDQLEKKFMAAIDGRLRLSKEFDRDNQPIKAMSVDFKIMEQVIQFFRENNQHDKAILWQDKLKSWKEQWEVKLIAWRQNWQKGSSWQVLKQSEQKITLKKIRTKSKSSQRGRMSVSHQEDPSMYFSSSAPNFVDPLTPPMLTLDEKKQKREGSENLYHELPTSSSDFMENFPASPNPPHFRQETGSRKRSWFKPVFFTICLSSIRR